MSRRERIDELRVVQDGKGCSKGAQEIFNPKGVDPVLDAKPAISLRKNRGREADHPYTPVSRGGSVSHHIQHGSTTHNDHDRLSIHVELIESFLQPCWKALVILRPFPSGYDIGPCCQFHVSFMAVDIGGEISGKVGPGFEHAFIDDDKEAVTTIRLGMGDSLEEARIGWIEGVVRKVDRVAGRDKKRLSVDRTVSVCRHMKTVESCLSILPNSVHMKGLNRMLLEV